MPCLLLDHDRNCDLDAYGTQSSPSCSCSMRHHDWLRLTAETSRSDPASCLLIVQITNWSTSSEFATLYSRRSAGPFESYGDAEVSFMQSYSRDALARAHNDSIPICKPQSTYGTVCGSTARLDPSKLVCGTIPHNGTDHNALNANDVHEISKSRRDDVVDIPVHASLSADHEQYNLVYDFFFETLCIGHVFVTVCGLLRLRYCMIIAYS
eukprot:SAG31_NODE_10035_length_1192_cov_5.579140_1_plen_209_part_10